VGVRPIDLERRGERRMGPRFSAGASGEYKPVGEAWDLQLGATGKPYLEM
jgi:hypothetical protein